jgi:C1A family cysteine protease
MKFNKSILLILPLLSAGCNFISSTGKNEGGPTAAGCNFDKEKYDKVEVFEALAAGSKNALPERVSLLKYAPEVMSQGQQGSCVAWATAYAACTINESVASGINPNQLAFSPSFLYNQVKLPNCYGSNMENALYTVMKNGLVPFDRFTYDEKDCSKQPSSDLFEEAKDFKIKGFNRLTEASNIYKVKIDAVKQNLAQGAPVLISMTVPESFCKEMWGKSVWRPKSSEKNYTFEYFSSINSTDYDCHAMCAIGYDDNKNGGSFQIMNSWGKDWGDNGFFWISYEDFSKYGIQAFGLFPAEKKNRPVEEPDFSVAFGLIDASTNLNIPLESGKSNIFQTIQPIRKNSKFKIEVANSEACYIYVFGQETDGSTYVLFPYLNEGETKSKYSPYCGIVGTRHFPSGKASLKADEIGNRDYIAVVVSKEELDYQDLNERMNRTASSDLASKLNKALGSEQFKSPKFDKETTNVSFEAKSTENEKLLGIVLAIDKS